MPDHAEGGHLGPSLAARGWRVVAPYLRGYAPSGLALDGGYALGALARDVQHLRARLSADADAVLIGHDWGAAVAYVVARPPVAAQLVHGLQPDPGTLRASAAPPDPVAVASLVTWLRPARRPYRGSDRAGRPRARAAALRYYRFIES